MKISACVITKNEENNLSLCLESIQSVVSEIIVVDTGSTDGTKEVAKAYQAKIYDFDWVNDFSKAKNFAISKAIGDWIIFLDADERFTTDSAKRIKKMIELAKKNKSHAIGCMLSNVNENGEVINSLLVVRIFKKSPDIRYIGSIHEYVAYKKGDLQLFSAVNSLHIIHTGYSQTEMERKNKGKRNIELLLNELSSNSMSSDLHFYLSEAYFVDKNFELGLNHAVKAKDLKSWKAFGLAQKNYLNMIQLMLRDKNGSPITELSNIVQEALNEFPTFPDFNMYNADIFIFEHRYEDAIESFNIAKKHMLEVVTSQTRSYLSFDRLLERLANCYYKTNQVELSVKNYVESLKFNKYHLPSIKALIEILSKQDSSSAIESFLAKMYDFSNVKDVVYLFKASLLAFNGELSRSFFFQLDLEARETLKSEEGYLDLLLGKYEETVTKFHVLYDETQSQEYLEKSFVAALFCGRAHLEQELQKTLPSLNHFGHYLLGIKNEVVESDYLSILNVILELVKLAKEKWVLERLDDIKQINLSYQVAEIFYENQKYDKALKFFDSYLESEPLVPKERIADILVKMADCLVQEGQLELALQFLKDARNIHSGAYQIYELGIKISEKLQDKEEMYYFANSGIARFPNSNFLNKAQKELPRISQIKKTSIVILTWNKLEFTKLCIESIRTYTMPGSYEIIIVDNASTDGTVDWLKNQSDIKVIYNSENKGFPAGCNQGIDVATGDNILLLNNDVIVTERWLENLVHALYSSDEIGAVGPTTNAASYYQMISVQYNSLEEMHGFSAKHNQIDSSLWEERLKLIGFCMLIKSDVVKQIGPLDERFTPGNFEDDDYSIRIRKAGFRLLYCKDTFIHHFGSTSWRDNVDRFNSLLSTNEQKFEQKWGFNSFALNFYPDLVRKIELNNGSSFRLLEVCCGTGANLLYTKNYFPQAELYGVESNASAGSIASSSAQVKVHGLKVEEWGFEESFFDYILLPFVLEEAVNPKLFIQRLFRLLKPNGMILAKIKDGSYFITKNNLSMGIKLDEDHKIFGFQKFDGKFNEGQNRHHSNFFLAKGHKKRFVTLFPEAENVHLTKDVGMVPFIMNKYFDFDSMLICYKNGEYPYSTQEVKGLKIGFLERSAGDSQNDGNLFLTNNAKNIDILHLFHLDNRSLVWIHTYKSLNPNGMVYLKLDANINVRNLLINDGVINILKMCDLISVETQYLYHYLNEIWPLRHKVLGNVWPLKIEYIPNGFYDNGKRSFIPFNEKENIICTVGRIGTIEKANEILLEGFKLASPIIPNWKLKVIGPITDQFKSYIEGLMIENPNLKNKIIFTGEIADKYQLDQEYRKAKIFCLTSRSEGFPLVFTEAAKNGCYIISSDLLAAWDITCNKKYGDIFEIDNIEKLAEKFIINCSDELLSEKSLAMQKYAYDNFYWVDICGKIKKLLEAQQKLLN